MPRAVAERPTRASWFSGFDGGGALIRSLSRLLAGGSVVVLVGLLPWLSTNSPEYTVLRARYADLETTEENLAAVREELGLDRGPASVFFDWFAGLLRGDAGDSWISGAPVLPGTLQATGVSLTLMGCAVLVAFILAALVCAPALRRGRQGRPSRGSGLAAVSMTALPEFLLASVLLVVGVVWLGWFPPYGWSGTRYVVLPALALGIPAGGLLGRLASDAISATFTERWVTTWRMAGADTRLLLPAILRRALAPLVPQAGLVLISLTGGAVAVEQVYAFPGLGRMTLGAASAQDIPALQAGVLCLLVLAGVIGIIAGAVRRFLLGPALALGSVPAPSTQRPRRRRDYGVPTAAGTILALIILLGLTRDPEASEHARLASPSVWLPFGADASGRDLLGRVGHGALTTLGTASVVVLVCLLIGLLLGIFPRFSTGFSEVANAAPPIIAGIIVSAVAGPGTVGAAVAVAAVSWAPLAAHTASLVTEARSRPHISVLPVLGVGKTRILLRHILPSVVPPVARHAVLRLPGIALALAALGFLGLGPQPPTPEWGLVLSEGIQYVERAPWTVLAPACALILASVLAVSLSSLPPRGTTKVVDTTAAADPAGPASR